MGRTRSIEKRQFYETEALRGGWSVRQLDQQISRQFFSRTLLSNSKREMLEKGDLPNKSEAYSPIELVALCRIAQAR